MTTQEQGSAAHPAPTPMLSPDVIDLYGTLDPAGDAALDGLVALVAERFGSSRAEISLVGERRVWLKAAVSRAGSIIVPENTICAFVAETREPLVLTDARLDSRFASHPRVTGEDGLRFYAGVPLVTSDGTVLGALCAWDLEPRTPSQADVLALERFGSYATAVMELHRSNEELAQQRAIASATGSALELMVGGADLTRVLEILAHGVEDAFAGARCSFMLLDGDRLIRGAGPSLPRAYLDAIDGATIGPAAGSCGTAAFTGRTVISADIATDPRWDKYRAQALPFGLRSCWSVPLVGARSDVLGTIALFHSAPVSPTDEDRQQLSKWVHLSEFAITRAREIKALREAATVDPLTGLLNRSEVLQRIRVAVALSPRSVAVLFVDLDQFKFVNDTLGHAVADQFLRMVAVRLREAAGERNTVARYGGDEFLVLCPEMGDAAEAESLARAMVDSLRQPITIDGKTLSMSASIGVALHPATGFAGSIDLVGNADLAMYAAKRAGRNSVAVFTPSLREQAADRLSLEADLAYAMTNGDMTCAYQPIVDLRTGRVTGFESVLRWNSPHRGSVPPITFIPVAEDSGLFTALGEFVLRRSAEQLARWRAEHAGWSNLAMWINVSPRQLRDRSFPALVTCALQEAGLPPDAIGIEVTESTVIDDASAARSVLLQLRAGGTRIAIDDFGTGYSSLAQLRYLPVDVLKIDQQFIADIDTDPAASGVVEAIMTLARTMKLQVVAEGVESEHQRRRLTELNCPSGQGYLWSPARSETSLAAAIEALPTDSEGVPYFELEVLER